MFEIKNNLIFRHYDDNKHKNFYAICITGNCSVGKTTFALQMACNMFKIKRLLLFENDFFLFSQNNSNKSFDLDLKQISIEEFMNKYDFKEGDLLIIEDMCLDYTNVKDMYKFQEKFLYRVKQLQILPIIIIFTLQTKEIPNILNKIFDMKIDIRTDLHNLDLKDLK